MTNKTIGNKLKQLRINSNLSQKDVADYLNIDQKIELSDGYFR